MIITYEEYESKHQAAADRQAAGDEMPVIVSQQEILDSEKNRDAKRKTVRQLPIMRAVSNLAFCIAHIEVTCPRKLRCLTDELERLSTELIRSIDFANEDRINRALILNDSHSLLITIAIKLDIMYKMNAMSNDENKKIKNLINSAISQVAGWRSSMNHDQGSVNEVLS